MLLTEGLFLLTLAVTVPAAVATLLSAASSASSAGWSSQYLFAFRMPPCVWGKGRRSGRGAKVVRGGIYFKAVNLEGRGEEDSGVWKEMEGRGWKG